MTWLRQVWHIARKDVQEDAWPLSAYLAVTIIAALVAFAPPGLGYAPVFAFIVFLLGMIVAATAVQSDSPTASESFWGSRPFRPTAMLGAKVLLATIIVVIPSIAQGVALLGFDADGRQAALAIADSAKTYALWLLAAMVIAGLTRDVRTFIVAFAAISMALALTVEIGADLRNTLAPPPPQNPSVQAVAATQPTSLVGPAFWTIIAVSLAVALLVFLYRRRHARRGIWIVAIAVVMGATIATFSSTPPRVQAATAASTPKIPFQAELLRSDSLGKDNSPMNIRVAADPDTVSRRIVLAVDGVIVHLKDGTVVTVRGNQFSSALVAAGNPFASNLRWLRSDQDRVFSSIVALPLSFDQRSAISNGFTGLELVGTVFLLEPRTVGLLPVESKRSLVRDGSRFRIVSATPAPDGGTVVVHATSLPRPEAVTLPGQLGNNYAGRQVALVNEARREAAFLSRSGGGGGASMLVLPSMPLTDETSTLELKSSYGTVALDSMWFKGARLVQVRWMLRGQYNVHVPIVEVPTAPELRSQGPITIQRSGNFEPLRAVLRP